MEILYSLYQFLLKKYYFYNFNVFVDEETFEKYSRNLHNSNDDNEDELNSKLMGLYI